MPRVSIRKQFRAINQQDFYLLCVPLVFNLLMCFFKIQDSEWTWVFIHAMAAGVNVAALHYVTALRVFVNPHIAKWFETKYCFPGRVRFRQATMHCSSEYEGG